MLESEPDTCRICRGEATSEEPLYHPCKCSGSIRYVHQDCLMEWLKHSQRSNYCELCHSRFIITNLYASDMPSQLPIVVLMKSFASHIASLTRKGLRIMLVSFVWLLYFPIVTRYAIRYYFKLSDGPTVPLEQQQPQNGTDTTTTTTAAAFSSYFHISGGGLARDILEGQGICGVVLLGFLSIFFIREWIIQNGAFRLENTDHDAAVADIIDEQRLVAEVQGILAQGRQRRLAVQQQQHQQQNNEHNQEPYRIEPDLGVSSSSAQADNMEGLRARRLMHFDQQPPPLLQETGDGESDTNNNDSNTSTQDTTVGEEEEQDERRLRDEQYQRVLEAAAAIAENPQNDQQEEDEEEEDDDDDEEDGLEARFDEGVLGDGDELDGVMELIGLQGSISMLIQNGLVATMLMTGVLGISVFFPYVVGKIFFLFMLYPWDLLIRFPIKTALFMSDEILDGIIVFMSDFASRISRVIVLFSGNTIQFSGRLSIESQESVAKWAWSRLATRTNKAWDIIWNRTSPVVIWNSVLHPTTAASGSENTAAITPLDRGIAIGVGYGVILTIGYLYLSRIRNQSIRARDGRIFEFMNQTAFVIKVVFVIGLEMAVFPIFCGFLLDFAFLPLFETASVEGRIASFHRNPYIHMLAHWLLGTCYMFHFSLFVSFLRQIFRPGVLFFVRDPNDPAFKPMQDILERPLLSHLRKIAISALIYMMLIVFCIGSVVWALAYGFGDVILPLRLVVGGTPSGGGGGGGGLTAAVAQHGAAKVRGALTEFSIDGTLYNLLLPYFVSGIRFSNLMRKMWVWYFEHACRVLRLSHFILNKRRVDEEGYYNEEEKFVKDGYFVRAPDSDHTPLVRSENGSGDFKLDKKFFTAVNENTSNNEEDEDSSDASFTVVYRPPQFWLRIDLLLFGMWVFATGIGLTFTVVPLLVGRTVLAKLSGVSTLEIRDSYTLSIGLLIISGVVVIGEGIMKNWGKMGRMNVEIGSKMAVTGYVYFMLVIILPSLLTITADLYIGIPILTFIYKQEPVINFSQEWIITMIYLQSGYQILSSIRPDNRISRVMGRIFERGMLEPDAQVANETVIVPCLKVFGVMIVIPGLIGIVAGKLLNVSSMTISIRGAYPVVLGMVGVGSVCLVWGRLMRKWHNQIRDEVYLVGRQLHNMEEVR